VSVRTDSVKNFRNILEKHRLSEQIILRWYAAEPCCNNAAYHSPRFRFDV